MTWSDLPLKPTSRMLRQFSAALLVLFAAMAARQAARGHATAGWVLGGIAFIGVVGLIIPSSVRMLFIGSTVLAFPVGWVVTQVVLGLMYYVVLTPLALVFRWRGRDELQLRRRQERASFWIERREEPKPERYLKQF